MAQKNQIPEKELETIFSRILSPIKKEADPNLVGQFCLKINQTLDGIQLAIKLILSKIHSEQEWEILAVLYTLEACVKNCGSRFHTEIGKFRFLNELIKLISPKYFGYKTSDKVKKKVKEILYSWTQGLPDEPKIKEAYEMLRRQNIIQEDPIYVDQLSVTVEPRTKSGIFEDPDKSKRLQKLLQSRNPQDLEEANRLIKMMVKQDEMKSEKISSRINELDRINSSIKLLDEMLVNFNKETSQESELDTMKCIHEELNKFKSILIKLANETDDNDDGIGEIIKINDNLIRCLGDYDRVISGGTLEKPKHEDDTFLINTQIESNEKQVKSENYDPFKELQELFSSPTVSVTSEDAKKDEILAKYEYKAESGLLSSSTINQQMPPSVTSVNQQIKNPLEDQFELLNLTNPHSKQIPKPPSLNELQKITNSSQPPHLISLNLDSIFVPISSIKPSSQAPKTLIDRNNIKIVLHTARDSPAQHVYTFVVSITSLNEYSLSKISFQASVPSNMKVKLQPASSTDLPSYNPILPLSAITQVMLVANPMQDKLKIRFKLNYLMNGMHLSESGEINDLTVINEIL